ncbi:UDP-glucose 4-epimerase GalE [Shimwellia blattae]|uniref:UDP-glucose 4-epimerase n=1 Tax=Shimwellia blattae (strain ATCC 29907 / DSM 4481 / JCM 1650 / NBRC 105725 / CDC 9005-74) TaxID=630626 RepID=I2B550_SHIBC|nr:UDP-glucose 4-epimerase GalE [Shimwellia blattae]AFJ45654.1 UDP-glucose 4-epimerase [Shimwellia blattae DSM 4481 = NBRC 105725]VDY63136.1 UDP-glucose 4-epimerase [Shimwellia blattae]VEC20740.1 UDP-glucose 4-epimerase [Shimwellia blattae]
MAILVTGGAGYIGSHTVLALLERGDEVVVVDNLSNASRESLNRVAELAGKAPVTCIGDVRDTSLLRTLFARHDITDVIHFAGLKSVSESISQPLAYYENNVLGTVALLGEMQHAGVHSLIFSSSATVYGTPEKVPLDEQCLTAGTTNPYGTSKLMAEQILRDFSRAQPRFTITCLRYFNPVGAHRSGKIGEDPRGIPNNLVPYISQVAIGKLDCLSVYGNDYPTRDGTGVRDYIHVMDLACGHLAALDHQPEDGAFRAINLGTGTGYSVLELIGAFEKEAGRKVNYRIAPRRPGDIAECWSDPSLAHRLLGWRATHSLDDMIRDTWNWQKKNPQGYQA